VNFLFLIFRDLTFSPTDIKFASCSDDSFIKLWDFKTAKCESILRGHGSDVKSCDWHPFNSIIASGSKDNYVKLWDAKSSKNIATLYGHKSAIYKLKWNKNGNWLLSCGRDQLIKLFDIRFMKEYETYRGHKKEVTSISWHPFHEKLFCSGGHDGDILYWTVGNDEHQGSKFYLC
jgi:polyadenylation factor subunit 2